MKGCRNKRVAVIQLGSAHPFTCGCKMCNSSGGNSGGDGGIDLPSGGNDGDVLAKNGNSLIWIKPEVQTWDGILVPISFNGQTLFTDAVPQGKNLFALFLNGVKQRKGIDYIQISGTRNISWISSISLITQLSMSIDVN